MFCRRCGKPLGNASRCNFCGFDNADTVRELRPMERDFYDGVTIDADSPNSQRSSSNSSYNRAGYQTRTFFYFGNEPSFFSRFLSALFGGSILAKIAFTLIFIAISALLVFIALPIFFVILTAGLILYIFAKIRR